MTTPRVKEGESMFVVFQDNAKVFVNINQSLIAYKFPGNRIDIK